MQIDILVSQFCEYSTYIKGLSKHTISRYRTLTKSYCNIANIVEIEEVTPDNVKALFFIGRSKRNWKSSTFIAYHKTLLVFFRWCVKEGYMNSNPAEDIEIPRLEKRIPPKFTRQEAMRILESVYNYPYYYRFERHRNYAIFATFLFAGLRKGELLSLKYADVDLENLTIFVRQGKGAKDRMVPISHRLAEALNKYLVERVRLRRTCPEFFTSRNHNAGLSDSGLKHVLEKVVDASGLKFGFHKLRHTFATLMLEGGSDIFTLSKLLGHSDIKTTTIYLAATMDQKRKEISKHPLNDLLGQH